MVPMVTEFLSGPDHTWSTAGLVYRLHCPICGFDYNHEGRPVIMPGHDDYAHGLGVRGDVTVIPFECEEGHRWALCFGFHKGNVYVYARPQDDPKL